MTTLILINVACDVLAVGAFLAISQMVALGRTRPGTPAVRYVSVSRRARADRARGDRAR